MEISYQQIRDLMPASESPERGSVDVSRAFGLAKVSSVRHAGRPMVRDLRGGTDLPLLAVRLEKIIVLSPSRPRSTESVALPARKKQSRGVHCVCAVAAVDLVRPLPPLRANSLDIRRLMPVSAIGIYPDLYRLPPPFATRVWRTVSAAVDIGVRASWRIAAAFVVSAGLIALVLFTVKSEIERGYETLMETRESSSLSAAYESLWEARSSFSRARILFAPIALFSGFLPHEVGVAANASDGWYALSDALQRLVTIVDDFERQGGGVIFTLPDPDNQNDQTGFSATAYLSRIEPELRAIHDELKKAILSYRAIGTTGDPSLDRMLSENLDRLSGVEKILGSLLDNYDGLLTALGETKPMRYLVLNQNRDEIRASGGFPGTLFFAELYQGRVRQFEKYDVYDIDWKIAPYREPPPPPLRELTANFWLRDANYFIDFHETAKKVNFFFEKAGYESLDGVFAIHQGIVEEFLREYGSVRIPSLGVDVTAENFSALLSVITEAKIQPYEQTGKDEFVSPKSFLFEFADELTRRLVSRRDFAGYASLLSDNASNGEILFSSIANRQLDALAAAFGFNGAWKQRDPAGDWIYPAFTSLSGNKSDRYMQREFSFESEIDSSDPALCVHKITLSSRHSFTAADSAAIRGLLSAFSVPSDRWDELLRIQWDARNRVHVRFAVPAGATLVDATAPVSTDTYPTLTTLSTTIETKPGESGEFRMRYRVPARSGACSDPTLLLQPGLRVR